MKESKLIEMSNKVESLGRVVQQLIFENQQLKTLSVGNMEVVKLLPGYEDAIATLRERSEKEKEEPKKD